jgi:hypothetical protein
VSYDGGRSHGGRRGQQNSNPQPIESVVCIEEAEIQCASMTPSLLVGEFGWIGQFGAVRRCIKAAKLAGEWIVDIYNLLMSSAKFLSCFKSFSSS